MFHRFAFSVCALCLGISSDLPAQEFRDAADLVKTDTIASGGLATYRIASAGETNAGETKAGETKAGETNAGETNAPDAFAIQHQLELLKKRRHRLSLNLGEAHPTMLRLDESIQALSAKLPGPPNSAGWGRDFAEGVANMKEDELRELVNELVKRVLVLEKEVHHLQESPKMQQEPEIAE